MRKTVAITAFSLALLSAVVYYAPFFLVVSDRPVKSDALVLFLGGEKGTREKEANQLVVEGYADYLIIPAHNQVKKLNSDGTLVRIDLDLTPKTSNVKRYFEDTHQEAIIARDMMERLGSRSAILVSSPYHMRRIKLITERVFGESETVCYVPTRYEKPNEGFWLYNNDLKFVLTEYVKIGWFLLYSPFV